MVLPASRWTNLALALVAIAGLAVAVVPIDGSRGGPTAAGPAAVAAPSATAEGARLAPRGAPASATAPAAQPADALVDALARSAAVQGVSSRKPPLPALGGGGPVAFNHRGDRVASQAGRGVVLWDTATWTVATTIQVEGSLCDLRFSPDDRFLYVGGGGRKPIFARYDTTTGRRDRDYAGRQSGLISLVLSRDGRTVAGQSLRDREVVFHDADSGEILKSPRLPGWSMKPAPDGSGVLTRGDEGWRLEPFRGGPAAALEFNGLETQPSTSSTVATCDDPDLVVLVNRRVEPGLFDEAGSLTVCRRTGDVWAFENEVRVETARMLHRARLSRSGRLLATAGPGNVVRVYTVPDFRERGQVRFAASRASDLTVETLAFSPDDGWLVVGTHAPLPGLVRIPTDAGQPLVKTFPWIGHGDRVEQVGFTSDGKRVITRAVDQTVCLWDAQTLEMEKRYALPDGYEAVAEADEASPWILCVPDGWPGAQAAEGWPLKVVDAERGDVLYETRLPPGFLPDSARRTPDGTLLLVGDDLKRIGRFDCARGVLVSTVTTTTWIHVDGELSPDQSVLRRPPALGKGTCRAEITEVDLRSGNVVERTGPSDAWVSASSCGFVPGGRYLFAAGEELILFGQESLTEVARRPLGSHWPAIAFSGDGNRYATRIEWKAVPESTRKRLPPDAVEVVSVHETLEGTLLFAAPLATPAAHLLLDTDGRRLVVVGEDGRLTRWTLPVDAK